MSDDTAAMPPAPNSPAIEVRPRLRGRLHLVTAIASVAGLALLVRTATTTPATIAAWIYGLAGVALYSTSSTYHVFTRSPRARRVMQRLDHSMIFVLIAGTFTPICLLALTDAWRFYLLGAVWVGAAIGAIVTIVALERYHRVSFAMYLVLGWAGIFALPALLDRPLTLLLVFVAGVLYTVGAVLFGLHLPRLSSAWFGYHELWHVFGVAAGALFFVVNFGLVSSAAG